MYRRAQYPTTPFQPSFSRSFSATSSYASSSPTSNGHSSPRAPSVPAEEPLYLCMPSSVAMETWIVMAHCFAQPEFLVSTGATTPRPMRRGSLQTASTGRASSNGHYGADDGLFLNSEDEDHLLGEQSDAAKVDDTRYRIYRSLTVAINEGRGLGEVGVEVVRNRPKTSSEGWRGGEREGSGSTLGSTYEGLEGSPSKGALPVPQMPARTESSSSTSEQTVNTFCEIVLEGDVLARTSVRKGTNSPFWNETFIFRCAPAGFSTPSSRR